MRRVVAIVAASVTCLAAVIFAEMTGIENGLGGVLKILGAVVAASCAATAWWTYRQVRAERRFDAELDAELDELETQAATRHRVTRFEDKKTGRVVTLGRPARYPEGTGSRAALPGGDGSRSRILAVGGALALVMLAIAVVRPDLSWADDDGHDPADGPSGSNSGDFILRYRPPGTTTEFPNGCTLNYVEGGVVFEGCPGTLADLLGGIPDDS